MKLNVGQLIVILSAFPPQTKVVLEGHDDFEVKERELGGEVVIGIGAV
jgi:hypothetical protein